MRDARKIGLNDDHDGDFDYGRKCHRKKWKKWNNQQSYGIYNNM